MRRSIHSAERTAAVAAALLATLALAAPARALAEEPRDAAKAHFDRAELHYKLGRFAEAIVAYTTAYETFPLPEILFNIGQCHRSLANHERAVFFFRGYLRDRPDAANRALVETFIAEGLRALEAEKAAKAGGGVPAPATGPSTAGLVVPDAAPPHGSGVAPPVSPAPRPRSVARSPWLWLGVGGAAVVAAVVVAAAFAATPGTAALPSGSLGTLDRRE